MTSADYDRIANESKDYAKYLKPHQEKSSLNKKRILVKWRKVTRFIFSPVKQDDQTLTERQRAAIMLVRKLIRNPKSSFSIAPISNTCYIENGDYYIVLGSNSISINKGEFCSDVALSIEQCIKLLSFFDRTVESIRKTKEAKKDANVAKALNKFIEQLDNENDKGKPKTSNSNLQGSGLRC